MDFYDLRFDSNSSSLIFKDKQNQDTFKIYAHKNELLVDHIYKTLYVFDNLKDGNVIKGFYNHFYEKKYINISFDEFISIIEDFIFFHDIGKLSFNFQIKRLNKYNAQIKKEQEDFLANYDLINFIDMFEANHSFSGALAFLSKYEHMVDENRLFIIILAFSIYGHHTSLKSIYYDNDFTFSDFSDKDMNSISSLLLFLNIANRDQIESSEYDPKYFQNIQKLIKNFKTSDNSVFSFFYNYIYSLLISADILASREYSKTLDDIKKIDFNNRISKKLFKKMKNAFYNVEYNIDINNKNFSLNLDNIHDINILRKNMLLESSHNLNETLKSDNHNNIFFLNLPTGGGKTNTSMKLALDLIENTNANRIIYAMPFINIIEQNYDIIRDNFNLNEDDGEIRKIYSATETIFSEKSDEFKSKIILQDNFFNYPVICTTFSTFFDSILRTKKGNKYKISSLTNSVVILDEIQSLPLINWNSLYYLINEMADKYNIYFIIMSATLPQFHKLKIDFDNNFFYENANQLINVPELYFDHYLFDRTKINEEVKELSIDDTCGLKEYFLEKINFNFNIGYNKGLIVLNTIKSSKLIYDLLCETDDFDIDLLNSSLLSNVKQKIIYKINNMGKDKSKKYILVSTQSIEAGVDVSFDFVIRDFSILDSIEQVRGRCNRSRELNVDDPYKKGNIYLINLKDKKKYIYEYIYNFHEINSRIIETSSLLNSNLNYKYKDILNYYNNVSDDINDLEDDKEINFMINDRDNIYHWNNLEYSKLQDKDGIHIIDNNSNQYSIFIPINMEIFHEDIKEDVYIKTLSDNDLQEIYSQHKENFLFSIKELQFLRKIEKDSHKIFENNCINGKFLVEYYKNILSEHAKNFNDLIILKKEFSSILNKFIVNVSINNLEVNEKIKFEFEKIGYFYIMDEDCIGDDDYSLYSIKRGLNYYPKIVEIL